MESSLKKSGYVMLHKILVRIKEYNKGNIDNSSYILCPNHTSDLDGPILWSSVKNIRIMAKKECFNNKLLGSFFRKINIVSVDRSQHNGTEIRSAVRYLKDKSVDKVFMMFPQGTISNINKNTLSRIMPGVFAISALSGTPIIPVFIEQPRFFRKSRIVYGEAYTPDVLNEKNKIDEEKLALARTDWQTKILKLQQLAVELGKRPIRELKLSEKHANNNQVDEVKRKVKRRLANN